MVFTRTLSKNYGAGILLDPKSCRFGRTSKRTPDYVCRCLGTDYPVVSIRLVITVLMRSLTS